MIDAALLLLRVVGGGLLAGHGAQKLFGLFGGHGLQGTAGMLHGMGVRPGHRWAPIAGLAETAGGALTVAGLASPLGSISVLSSMGVAIGRAHWGRPIWVTEGGAELPLTNVALFGALALAGPGRWSLDRALGIRVPWPVTAAAASGAAAGLALAMGWQPMPRRPGADRRPAADGEVELAGRPAEAGAPA